MNEETILNIHQSVTVATKLEAIKRHGTHSDIDPMVTAQFDDRTVYLGHPRSASIAYIEETNNVIGCIVNSVHALWVHKRKQAALLDLTLCLEGYQQMLPGDTVEIPHLERDFRTNPASTVSEILSTIVCENDAVGQFQMWSVIQPYHYSDGGVLVFGDATFHDPEDPTSATEGHVPEELTNLFNMIGRKP